MPTDTELTFADHQGNPSLAQQLATRLITQDKVNVLMGAYQSSCSFTATAVAERYGVPFKEGGRYFFSKNDGLQNQSVLYTITSLNAQPRVLLDPNQLSSDGTVALSGLSISDHGNLMAYSLPTAGSEWEE